MPVIADMSTVTCCGCERGCGGASCASSADLASLLLRLSSYTFCCSSIFLFTIGSGVWMRNGRLIR